MSDRKTILVCPLNWGLGHASRDIPIIRQLMDLNHRVIIGGAQPALSVLETEFPVLHSVSIPDIRIRYSRRLPAWVSILIRTPFILLTIIREHFHLKKLIGLYEVDIVISDNRYGLWNKHTRSIIITHQTAPRLPFILRIFEYPLNRLINVMIGRFDECWIPDVPGTVNLAGLLARRFTLPVNSKFIGFLSRFQDQDKPEKPGWECDLLVILSGPEPQRTELERMMKSQIIHFKGRILVVTGEPEKSFSDMSYDSCRFVSHLDTQHLLAGIYSSKYLICRAGYTSIMDLVCLKKKALLVPTPGQTEQLYLSRYLESAGIFPFEKQKDFHLSNALKKIDDYLFDQPIMETDLLTPLIKSLGKPDSKGSV